MAFLAPIVCLLGGIGAATYTLYWWKKGGTIKLSTLILAIIGVPAGIAYLLQYFGFVNIQILAQGLGQEYYQKRTYDQQIKDINQQVANGEISQEQADIILDSLKS